MQRGINIDGSKPLTGLIVLTIGGFCFGMLTPLFFIATSALPTTDHWRILPEGCAPPSTANWPLLAPAHPPSGCPSVPHCELITLQQT